MATRCPSSSWCPFELRLTREFCRFNSVCFFLRKDESCYRIVDPHYPFVITSLKASRVQGTEIERVINEIAYILSDVDSPAEDRRKAVYVLDSAHVPSATEALRRATTDSDKIVRFQALAALLRRNESSHLAVIERILISPPAVEEYLIQNLAFALDNIRDPQAIPFLTRLLSAGTDEVRYRAASALRNIGGANVIKPLITALDDNNRRVRYEAVVGLAEITGQSEWAPAVDSFQREESKFLSHWKDWARSYY